MKKIIVSLSIIAAVAAVAVGATTAFFSDTETSTGNTFTAGAIDLKIDDSCHYYQNGHDVGCDNWGNWTETDLQDGVQKFFNFNDIKPGDWGENTISLHVYDNDAWGHFGVRKTSDVDKTCTEPEQEVEGQNCAPEADGELDEHMSSHVWLDEGAIPGFQNVKKVDGVYVNTHEDPTEGDNEWQQGEPMLGQNESFFDITYKLDGVLSQEYRNRCTDDGDPETPVDGHNGYGLCHGLAQDGRVVGSTTYYIGWKWAVDGQSTGNDVQTDMVGGDVWFKAEQHRNNPQVD